MVPSIFSLLVMREMYCHGSMLLTLPYKHKHQQQLHQQVGINMFTIVIGVYVLINITSTIYRTVTAELSYANSNSSMIYSTGNSGYIPIPYAPDMCYKILAIQLNTWCKIADSYGCLRSTTFNPQLYLPWPLMLHQQLLQNRKTLHLTQLLPLHLFLLCQRMLGYEIIISSASVAWDCQLAIVTACSLTIS